MPSHRKKGGDDGDKEKASDKMKRVFKNGLNPILDDGGHKIGGVLIKAGQEVIYSKIIRKVMKRDTRSWMHLVVFSLLTSAFDDGLGAWYSSKKDFKASADMKMSDVIKEFPRPLLSCLAINWIMATANQGFHNPMKSFSFRELLIALAAKDIATGGNMILAKNMENSKKHIERFNQLQEKQRDASRLKPKPKE